MKNLLKFFNRSGKMALSALQAGGIAAVVGVAGLAAWQYIGGSGEDNTAYNPFQQDAGEVVYVAGANSGSYERGSYYGNGAAEQNSSFNVSAKALNRLDRQAQAEQAAREMAEESSSIQASSSASSDPLAAYETGGTEGLGMGANAVNDNGLASGSNNPMAAMAGSMGNIQGMIANAQQQAQAAAQGKAPGGEAAAAGAPALASAQADWGSKFGSGGSGGSGSSSSTFSIQDSGKNKNKGNGAAAGDVTQQIANMQAQAQSMLDGARIRGKSSFGDTENLGNNRNATIGKGGRSTKGDVELEQIRKHSADIAANKNRAANEGMRPFLASTQLSGGVMVTKDNFQANSSQGTSTDFNTSFGNTLGAIQTFGTETLDFNTKKLVDYTKLFNLWIGVAIGTVIAMILISAAMKGAAAGGPYAWVFYLIAAAVAFVALAACVNLCIRAGKYASEYGGSAWSTWAGISGIVFALGIGASFFLDIYGWMKDGIAAIKGWMSGAKDALSSFGQALKNPGQLLEYMKGLIPFK